MSHQATVLATRVGRLESMVTEAFREKELLQAEILRLNGELSRLGTRWYEKIEKLRQEKRNQFQALTSIRMMADKATGIQRTRGDQRRPGAQGAVAVLVEKYEAALAELAELKQQNANR